MSGNKPDQEDQEDQEDPSYVKVFVNECDRDPRVCVLPLDSVWSLRMDENIIHLFTEGGNGTLPTTKGDEQCVFTKRGLFSSKYKAPIISWTLVLDGTTTGAFRFEVFGFSIYCPIQQLKHTPRNPRQNTYDVLNKQVNIVDGPVFNDTIFEAVKYSKAKNDFANEKLELTKFFSKFEATFEPWMSEKLEELNIALVKATDTLRTAQNYAHLKEKVFFVLENYELDDDVPFGCFIGEDCILSGFDSDSEFERPIQRPTKTFWSIFNPTPNVLINDPDNNITRHQNMIYAHTYISREGEYLTRM